MCPGWQDKRTDGEIRDAFIYSDVSMRCLGDLYRDLSECVRKTYAPLQNPVFVEELIRDLP